MGSKPFFEQKMLIFGFAVHIWRSYCGPIDKRNPPSTGPNSAAVLGVFLFEKLGEEHRRFGTAKVAIFVESKRTVVNNDVTLKDARLP